jgi:hypothetical protein
MKIDLHSHTSHGSSCAYMDPDQLVKRAKAVGLDGVCITDHDQIWARDAIQRIRDRHDFLVIGGAEVSTDCGEILTFGLHESVLKVGTPSGLRAMVDAAGGAMVLAHPFRTEPELVSSRDQATYGEEPGPFDALAQRPVFQFLDGMEVYNGQSGKREAAFTADAAVHLNLPGTGGSDAHAVHGVGSCYTAFEARIRCEKDLVEEIKVGRCRAVDTRWKTQ